MILGPIGRARNSALPSGWIRSPLGPIAERRGIPRASAFLFLLLFIPTTLGSQEFSGAGASGEWEGPQPVELLPDMAVCVDQPGVHLSYSGHGTWSCATSSRS